MPRPAARSDEFRDWLARGGDGFAPDPELDLQGVRAAREAYYGASAQEILARHTLTATEVDLNGVRARVITPDGAHSSQAIFYSYGGGFTFGSPEQDMGIIATLASRTRRAVVAPYYRLAPEHPFPAGLDDVTSALHAALGRYQMLALVGESAGATMVIAAAQRVLPEARTSIPAIAILSPCSDLADLGDSALTNRDLVLDLARVEAVPGLYAPNSDCTHPELSIVFGEYDAGFPPTLITTGTRDLFLSGCVRLERVMREAGAPVTLRVWEGMFHAFEFYVGAFPEAQASLAEICDHLARHLDAG